MEKICDNINFNMNYSFFAESDFFLGALGFDDFHTIAPLKTFRVQKFYTLHFVMSGKGTLEIYGKKFKVKPYDMFFIPPNESMCYYPDSKDPWAYIWFELSGERTEIYREKMGFGGNNPLQSCKKPLVAYNAIYELLTQPNKEDIGYYTLLSLFYRLVDTFLSEKTESPNRLKEQIKAYINCHFHDPDLKIENICRDFNISHSYLCKLFKEQGTVKELLTLKRINEAKSLLSSTDLTIGEVGYSVGYTDPAHFMKIFKKYIGIPAGEYRKKGEN